MYNVDVTTMMVILRESLYCNLGLVITRAFCELGNVRCSVRTVLVRCRNILSMYGDGTFHLHSIIIDHKNIPYPPTYKKDPTLLFKVKREGYDSTDDFFEPYVNVKRADCFEDYIKNSDKFRILILSD
jgi:hypothetical protein